MDSTTASLDTENCPPSNISLGQYLQPAQMSLASQSEPLSDSDEDDVPLHSFSSVPNPPHSMKEAASLLDTPPNPFLVPFPVHPASSKQSHVSSTPLQANLKLGTQLQKALSAQSAGWADSSSNSVGDFDASGGFPWDKIVKGEASQDISSLQKVSQIILSSFHLISDDFFSL
jgi:hypothetical protein